MGWGEAGPRPGIKTEGFKGQGLQGQHLKDEKSERTDDRWRWKQAVEREVSGAQGPGKPEMLCGAAGTRGGCRRPDPGRPEPPRTPSATGFGTRAVGSLGRF